MSFPEKEQNISNYSQQLALLSGISYIPELYKTSLVHNKDHIRTLHWKGLFCIYGYKSRPFSKTEFRPLQDPSKS